MHFVASERTIDKRACVRLRRERPGKVQRAIDLDRFIGDKLYYP